MLTAIGIIFISIWLLAFGYVVFECLEAGEYHCTHKTVMSLDSIAKRLCYDCRELIDQ